MRRTIRAATLAVCVLLSACAGTRPSSLAEEAGALVLVKEARIPGSEPWYARFATHAWFDLRPAAGAPWMRIEVVNQHTGVRVDEIPAETARSDVRWGVRRVRVRGLLRGSDAARAAQWLLAEAERYSDENYRAIPGPNSNTFVAALVDAAPALRTTLHHNAVGKDWRAPLAFARTPSKTGGRFDTPYFGVALGLQEGVELHLAGLSLGVGFWPPRVCVPFLPEIGPALPANGATSSAAR